MSTGIARPRLNAARRLTPEERNQLGYEAEFLMPLILAWNNRRSPVWYLFRVYEARIEADDYEASDETLLSLVEGFHGLPASERLEILHGWHPGRESTEQRRRGRDAEIDEARNALICRAIKMDADHDGLSAGQWPVLWNSCGGPVQILILQATPLADAVAMIRRLADMLETSGQFLSKHPGVEIAWGREHDDNIGQNRDRESPALAMA
jgi:hypothetical protein